MASLALETASLAQIIQKERGKTSDARWAELTTPPSGAIGYAATGAGALWAASSVGGEYRLPAALLGGVLFNYFANAVADDARQTGTELQDAVTHPLRAQTASTGKVVSAIEGNGGKPDVVDVLNTVAGAMDGDAMVQSVRHRNDPTWHPYGAVMADGKWHKGSVM